MHTPRDRQTILTEAQLLRKQAQQTCQWAVRARQATVMPRTHAQLTALRAWMPGATAMTCEITMVILMQRGLLDSPRRPRGVTVTPSPLGGWLPRRRRVGRGRRGTPAQGCGALGSLQLPTGI
jgi:hypothetical protein